MNLKTKEMEQWTPPAAGTTRIRNPKTLQRWIDTGKHQQNLDKGWIFNVGCGRYRTEKCECNKCRKSKNSPLKHVLDRNGYDVQEFEPIN